MNGRVPVLKSGFTLLEVILAMSLSIILLSALYAVLKLHLTYAQKAPQQVRRTLEARAIVDRIARDIRAVLPPSTMPQSSSGSRNAGSAASSGATSAVGDSASSSMAESTSGSTSLGTSDAYKAAHGVLGGTDWLQLYLASSSPNLDDLEMAASSGSVAQVSNIVRVSYMLTVLTTRQDAKGRTQRLALTRSEVASVGAERLDSSADDGDVRATTTYLGDDLAYVQFQYWDDFTASWLDNWGIDTPIAPPRAIRILVSLQDPDEYVATQLGVSGAQSTWEPTFQLVVPIATWVPESESDAASSGGM
jgi:prepilin-type N-terminal cleavage/methylation domain-containing protein